MERRNAAVKQREQVGSRDALGEGPGHQQLNDCQDTHLEGEDFHWMFMTECFRQANRKKEGKVCSWW